MDFDIEVAIAIGEHFRDYREPRGVIKILDFEKICPSSPTRWPPEVVWGHLRLMTDAGWVESPAIESRGYTGRLTMAGHQWLAACSDQAVKQRVAEAVARCGIAAGHPVIAGVMDLLAKRL